MLESMAIALELRSHASRLRTLGYSKVAGELEEWVDLLLDQRMTTRRDGIKAA